MWRSRWLILSAFVVLLVLGCGSHRKPDTAAPQAPGGDAGADADRIPVNADDPVRGSANAYVTLVLFSDFRCGYCNRVAPTIDRIRDAYPPDVLRIAYKLLPSPNLPQAKLASTVGQGVFALRGIDAFAKYRDLAVKNQQGLGPEVIRGWALSAGLNTIEIDQGLERGAWADKVERDMALAKKLFLSEPPVAFVNGVMVMGAPPFEVLKDTVDVELAKARLLENSGVPRSRIYAQAVAANSTDPHTIHPHNEIEDPRTVWKVPVGLSPTRGIATALVTIVEFSDFDCVPCKRTSQALEKIRDRYRDRVRLVWKDVPPPAHPRASPAAYMARAARAQKGDAGFWDMHDRLFAAGNLEDSDFESAARAAGLDAKTALAAVRTQMYKKDIDADLELADDVEVTATPQYFVNGRRLVGEQTYDKLQAMMEEEVKKAESLLRSGVEPTGLYEWFIKDGRPQDPFKKNVPLNPNAPYKGPVNAPLVIQVFSELPCGSCRRADPVLDEVMKAYPGLVKVAWRDLPTVQHPDAPLAAEAIHEAYTQKGNEGFWKMYGRMTMTSAALPREDMELYAKETGLDVDKFKKALDTHAQKPTVDAEMKVAAEAGIVTTPTFVVGNYVLTGVPGLARFMRFAARALAEAPKVTPATTPSGTPRVGGGGIKFSFVDLVVGTGPPAQNGDTLVIQYRARLYDGAEFDNTYKRGPTSFMLGVGSVIAGWDRGCVGMRAGGKRRITVPPDMGFGNHGVGKQIPPNAVIVFDVELVQIK